MSHYFRFTIRDVLWLTLVLVMGVGWFIEHFNNAQHSSRLKSSMEQVLFSEGWMIIENSDEIVIKHKGGKQYDFRQNPNRFSTVNR